MPNRWLFSTAIAAAIFFSQNASAQILVVPPILGAGLEPARDIIIDRVKQSLNANKIAELKVDRFVLLKLAQCKNKMSCISTTAQPTGASHALHIILARRQNKVLTQITLLDISNSNPVKRVRARASLGLSFIEKTMTDSMQKISRAVIKLPRYTSQGSLFRKPKASMTQPSNRVTMNSPPPISNPNISSNGRSNFGGPPPVGGSSYSGINLQADVPMVEGSNYIAYTFWGLAGALALASGASFAMYGLDTQARIATPQTEIAQRDELLRSAQARQTTGYVSLGSAVGVGLVGVLFQLTGWGASQIPAATPPPVSNGAGTNLTYIWQF